MKIEKIYIAKHDGGSQGHSWTTYSTTSPSYSHPTSIEEGIVIYPLDKSLESILKAILEAIK